DNNGKISSYTQVNLYAGYTFEMAGIESARVSFYADNVFNSERPTFIPANERRESIKQRPRSFGLTAEFKF
ncbi:MAG: TonB-dependent receptor, partial [Wohlfahrtiimonas sp.]